MPATSIATGMGGRENMSDLLFDSLRNPRKELGSTRAGRSRLG